MMDNLLHGIPPDFLKFLIVALFSLLIGLEQRRLHIKQEFESLFGTDRTFTLIGILGYVLYVIAPATLLPFLLGGGAISLLLGVYYFQKVQVTRRFGMTSVVTALITYCLAPLIYTQPAWLALLIIVLVLVVTEIKETLYQFSARFDNDEFITLAKFLAIAGVIVPLLPDSPVSAAINISPYKFALAIVAVSGISYLSYLIRKFIFPEAGIVLTGILGGLYSSTATTFILARKSRETNESSRISAAIILATMMMYVRLFLLAMFFNVAIAIKLIPAFAASIIACGSIAFYFLKVSPTPQQSTGDKPPVTDHTNPLEIKTALVFALLFIVFSVVTSFVTEKYGAGGINVLSFIVGVTDIDPFIMNLFQGKWNMADTVLATATLNAVTSNNLLKMIYGVSLADSRLRGKLVAGFGTLIGLGLLSAYFVHL